MAVPPKGDFYINIGTQKCCLFLRMSFFLIRKLKKHPLLYYAVEEGLQCARGGYYAAGIMALSQLLNVLNERTPEARNRVAHELLQGRPSKADYEATLQQVKEAAQRRYANELAKQADATQYHQRLVRDWETLMQGLLREAKDGRCGE